MIAAVLLGMTSHASADRTVWKGVFVGSMTMAVGGGLLWWSGVDDIRDAEQAMCDGGVAAGSCTPNSGGMLTPAQYEALRDDGERGTIKSKVGAAGLLVGVGVGAYAFYKGFIQDDEPEPRVLVTPAITPNGGGATLQLRW